MGDRFQVGKGGEAGRRGELTVVQARKVLNDILENAGIEAMKLQSVEVFFMDWLASKEAAKAKGTARRYRDAPGAIDR